MLYECVLMWSWYIANAKWERREIKIVRPMNQRLCEHILRKRHSLSWVWWDFKWLGNSWNIGCNLLCECWPILLPWLLQITVVVAGIDQFSYFSQMFWTQWVTRASQRRKMQILCSWKWFVHRAQTQMIRPSMFSAAMTPAASLGLEQSTLTRSALRMEYHWNLVEKHS